ncbi:unnamed protein product [Prunus armeniaca]|uniref:Retrotransposon gag domain-containing protein n=1 Tax=Prunus armeniaca TaxID=36596 RepID=A0A6J5VA49_PRUAR|nr:unnamed protein product [Prunus armeniaca]
MKRMQDEMDRKLELSLTALERERGPGPLDLKRYPPNYFLSIRQGPKEKLRDYINPFNREVISIPSCSKDTAYTAFLAGFRRGPFLFHVNKFPPKSYEDLVSEVYRHAIVEEMTYDTQEGRDPSQPGVGDKQREDRNDVREKPDYKKGRFENSK